MALGKAAHQAGDRPTPFWRSASLGRPPALRSKASATGASTPCPASQASASAPTGQASVWVWQRLRMVGSSRPGAELVSSSTALGGGSSSAFSSALAAALFIVSAPSTTTTRQPPSAAVRVMKPGMRRAASTLMSLRLRSPRSVSASIVSRSAWLSAATRRNTGLAAAKYKGGLPWGASGMPASSQRAKRQASVTLPIPAGPVINQA